MKPVTVQDRDIAIRTLIGEARGEPLAGQEAVAWVIRNRATLAAAYLARRHKPHPLFGDGTIAGVCKANMQFSCWNAGDPNSEIIAAWDPERKPYAALGHLLDSVLAAPASSDPTGGATHYFTVAAPRGVPVWPPAWSAKMAARGRFGAHSFFREG